MCLCILKRSSQFNLGTWLKFRILFILEKKGFLNFALVLSKSQHHFDDWTNVLKSTWIQCKKNQIIGYVWLVFFGLISIV